MGLKWMGVDCEEHKWMKGGALKFCNVMSMKKDDFVK